MFSTTTVMGDADAAHVCTIDLPPEDEDEDEDEDEEEDRQEMGERGKRDVRDTVAITNTVVTVQGPPPKAFPPRTPPPGPRTRLYISAMPLQPSHGT
jgi:hypothetical protein